MDIFEVKQKETVSREEVAERLRLLADMLAQNNDLEFDRGGMHFTVHVPDQLQLKVELEVETDEREARDRAEMVIARELAGPYSASYVVNPYCSLWSSRDDTHCRPLILVSTTAMEPIVSWLAVVAESAATSIL